MSSIRCRWTDGGDLAVLTHDLNGSANDVSFDATNGSGVVVGFDEGHRLTREAISNALYQWTATATGSTAYSPDRLNRYASVGGTGFTYDANGNLTSDGTWTYAYDPENWLLSATQPNKFRSYLYDPLGRRVKSNVDLGSTVFLHADDEEIGEYGAGGGLQLRYIPGPEIDRPIGWVTSGGAKRFFHADRRGSIIAVTNTSAGVTESPYSYDAYGAPSATTGTPIKYTGRRYDAETGLYYYRARYYSPGLGRFMQTDPVGYEAGMNLYDYASSDPVDSTDPSGELSYVVNRPVVLSGGFGQHMYIATHADYLGDPNATIYDWGPSGPGGSKAGPVSASSETRRDDVNSWARGNQLGFNAKQIDAPDELVDDLAKVADYGGRDYFFLGRGPDRANSNAAPTAVAVSATNITRRAAGLPDVRDPADVLPDQSNVRPGTSKFNVIRFSGIAGKTYHFEVTSTGSRIPQSRTVTCTLDAAGKAVCK